MAWYHSNEITVRSELWCLHFWWLPSRCFPNTWELHSICHWLWLLCHILQEEWNPRHLWWQNHKLCYEENYAKYLHILVNTFHVYTTYGTLRMKFRAQLRGLHHFMVITFMCYKQHKVVDAMIDGNVHKSEEPLGGWLPLCVLKEIKGLSLLRWQTLIWRYTHHLVVIIFLWKAYPMGHQESPWPWLCLAIAFSTYLIYRR